MKKKVLKIIACILIAAIFVSVGVILLSLIIREIGAVVKLEKVRLDSGTVTYLAALYKLEYLESVDPSAEPADTDAFWDKEKEEGLTYGQHFEYAFKEYLERLVADAYLYMTYHGYTSEDVNTVTQLTNGILNEYAHGSVSEFNEVAEDLGFDFQFSDFHNAVALRYQAGRLDDFLPGDMSKEDLEKARLEAIEKIKFTHSYYLINFIKVPMINEYYVK